jgi:hypothetical protein
MNTYDLVEIDLSNGLVVKIHYSGITKDYVELHEHTIKVPAGHYISAKPHGKCIVGIYANSTKDE